MAQRERMGAAAHGATFVARSTVMNQEQIERSIRRMAHEILERNLTIDSLVILGLQTGGVAVAQRLTEVLGEIEGTEPDLGTVDVAFHRDDIGLRLVLPEAPTHIPCDLTDKNVVLVDDVLFTGRTVRAALDACNDFGRPKTIQLAVMVDRGHRELPIRADYVGKNLPTSRQESVDVSLTEVAIGKMQYNTETDGETGRSTGFRDGAADGGTGFRDGETGTGFRDGETDGDV